MGKYMRRSKTTPAFPAMDYFSPQSPPGVRTRAKTLALHRLHNPSPDCFSFLQLRNRRLEKLPSTKQLISDVGSSTSFEAKLKSSPTAGPIEVEAEGSCGENVFEVEELNRKMRETTPSNLIRGSEDIETPGSSTRPSANMRSRSSVYRNIPTTSEMDEFFTGAEQSQIKLFTEKYNYDPVNDRPLPGRYEWAKLD